MWFDKETREEKDMLIISKQELIKIKDKLLANNNKIQMGDTYLRLQISEAQIELIDKIIELSEAEMQDIKHNTYIPLNSKPSEPYIEGLTIGRDCEWNPKYYEHTDCECGHSYYRHFDTYEQMDAIGCKYCQCNHFKPKI